MASVGRSARRFFARPFVWASVSVVVAAIVVLVTRNGIDVLGLLVALFVLLLVERTVGDWVAETVGPIPTILIFVTIAAIGVTYVSTDRGRSRLRRIFVAAEALGYHTAYFSFDEEGGAPDRVDAGTVGASLSRPIQASAPPIEGSGSSGAATPSPSAQSAQISEPAATPTPDKANAAVSSTRSASRSEVPSQAGGVHIIRLTVTPELAVTGQRLVFRADVTSDGTGVLPEVEFSVDGKSIGQVKPDAGGAAVARWTTKVPGQYVVRARPSGGWLGNASSATLNVLPAAR